MKALILKKAGDVTKEFELASVAKPEPKSGYVRVKIHATALNPVDWKQAKFGFLIEGFPIVLGADFSGVVDAVGEGVHNFKPGDEVFGFPQLGAFNSGTFAEFTTLPQEVVFKKPKSVSFEEASTYSVGVFTASKLFDGIGLPVNKHHEPKTILVWGASGSVGSYAVQIGALLGHTIIGVASANNHDFVKSLGAKYVVDRQNPAAIEEIKKYAGGELLYAVDTVGAETAAKCVQALSTSKPAFISHIAGAPATVPPNVTSKAVSIGLAYKENLNFFKDVVHALQPLIDNGKIRPNKVHHLPNGLADIVHGLQLLVDNKVSGEKIVVTVH